MICTAVIITVEAGKFKKRRKKVGNDRYSLINYEIVYNNKGNIQTDRWACFIPAFLVSSVTCKTLSDDVTWYTSNQIPITLSIYALCPQEMLSFYFQIITKSHFECLPSMSPFWPVCLKIVANRSPKESSLMSYAGLQIINIMSCAALQIILTAIIITKIIAKT